MDKRDRGKRLIINITYIANCNACMSRTKTCQMNIQVYGSFANGIMLALRKIENLIYLYVHKIEFQLRNC